MKKTMALLVCFLLCLPLLGCAELETFVSLLGTTAASTPSGESVDPSQGTTEPTECAHSWRAANCNMPRTCRLCGLTDGAPVHLLAAQRATCERPGYCLNCGVEVLAPSEHEWKFEWADKPCEMYRQCKNCREMDSNPSPHQMVPAANCMEQSRCQLCGRGNGERGPHSWKPATCSIPEHCVHCGYSEGILGSHQYENWKCKECGAGLPVIGNMLSFYTVSGDTLTQWALFLYGDQQCQGRLSYTAGNKVPAPEPGGEPEHNIVFYQNQYYLLAYGDEMQITYKIDGNYITLTNTAVNVTIVLEKLSDTSLKIVSNNGVWQSPVGGVFVLQ